MKKQVYKEKKIIDGELQDVMTKENFYLFMDEFAKMLGKELSKEEKWSEVTEMS